MLTMKKNKIQAGHYVQDIRCPEIHSIKNNDIYGAIYNGPIIKSRITMNVIQ
jgi:hypothetical protein